MSNCTTYANAKKMKKYVFLTPAIANFGGSQMYTANKAEYLERHGWEVIVFYTAKYDDYKIPYLKKFKDNFVESFIHYEPKSLPSFESKPIIEKIKKTVGAADEIVLESHFLWLALWGEIIAKEIGARHIVNFLEEPVRDYTPREYAFWEFKLQRWEFQNAGERSLKRVFKSHFKVDYLQYQNIMSYPCSNVIDYNTEYPLENDGSTYRILSIGRLDKPYIDPMIDQIIEFGKKHTDISLSVYFVGGSNNAEKEISIPKRFEWYPNIKCYMLGYTFPVPANLVLSCDMGLASSNSVLVSADEGIPTISIDMNDHKAIGVYGYDTNRSVTRIKEKPKEISLLMERILIEGCYPKGQYKADHTKEFEDAFDKEMLFIEKSSGNTGYYDILSMYSFKELAIARLKWFAHTKLGL